MALHVPHVRQSTRGSVAFVVLSVFSAIFVGFLIFSYVGGPEMFSYRYYAFVDEVPSLKETGDIKKRIVQYVPTPTAVKGIYMTGWVAGSHKLRQSLLDIIDTTEINSVVIDIKDYTGRISFVMNNDMVKSLGSSERRIADIEGLIDLLHERGVYVIGRISSFQDMHLVTKRPDLAVRKKGDGTCGKMVRGLVGLIRGPQKFGII